MEPRLGAVSYLNTRPLTVALERDASPFQLTYAVPSVCAAQLRSGQIDVGLIPVIEYARSAGSYLVVPDVAIGCRGEVLTVRLFYRGELSAIKRLALDRSSRTSVALLQVLLRERFGLAPQLVDAAPDLGRMLQESDAALLIGDPVFKALGGEWQSLDLGQAWFELTGLPFVFAFWAGRPDALGPAQVARLVQARREGLPFVERIARSHSEAQGVPADLCRRYLTEYIRYDLDEPALEGLRTFFRLAHRHGQIDAVPDLQFYPIAASIGGR